MTEIKDKIVTVESLAALHDYDESTYLKKVGGTVTGTTIFSKAQDVAGDAYNAPAVVIGGEPTAHHLELDNNEIQAKKNETTVGNLFLNSEGGVVTVGVDGLELGAESSAFPETALDCTIGTAPLPFNQMYSRYYNLYGAANAQYGRFRVGATGTESVNGISTLELGNNTASGTAHNASGKITIYGSGTGFTNILPNNATSGSNAVTLPTASGTMAIYEASTTDLTAGVSALSTGKLYFVYE